MTAASGAVEGIKIWFSRNWFIAGIFLAVIAGNLAGDHLVVINPGGKTVMILVIILFFFQGLKLPTENIISGLTNIRLHAFTQFFIFVVNPLFFFLLMKLFSQWIDYRLVIGIYALSCLPTSVSSCTVFTSMAGGNVSGTMFNAALSNIAGVFISPLLISLMLSQSGQSLPADEIIRVLISLFVKMVLPIVAGQIIRQFVKTAAERNRKRLNIGSNLIVLSILLFAIAGSGEMFSPDKLKLLVFPFILLVFSYPAVVFLTYSSGKAAGFDKGDIISSLFTGSQKTLAMGLPLLATYFASRPELVGFAVMPILFYQPYQLIVSAVMVNRIIKRAE